MLLLRNKNIMINILVKGLKKKKLQSWQYPRLNRKIYKEVSFTLIYY